MSSPEKSQREKFEEAARAFGAGDDVDAFEAAARKVAHSPKLTDVQIKELAKRQRRDKND